MDTTSITILIVGFVVLGIGFFNILKELGHIHDIVQDWRNDWEKEHGYHLNKTGRYEKHGD